MDLESFDKIEVRGNQLILTMEGDASGLDDSGDDEGGEEGGPPLPQLHEASAAAASGAGLRLPYHTIRLLP